MDIIRRIYSGLRPRKQISVAVIGFPASGKSYLISDLIASLKHVGFVPEKLPLLYPYNSLGAFFNDVFVNGGMEQTGRNACRSTDHYGACLKHKDSGRLIALDFLNIPGETFRDAEKQLLRYNSLVSAIKVTRKGVFFLTLWRNPSGKECLLLEPSRKKQKEFVSPTWEELEKSDSDVSEQLYQVSRRGEYQSWRAIFSELNYGSYRRVSSKTISGKYLLDHFFEVNTDSVFSTLRTVWSSFAPNLSLAEYLAEHAFHDFYYMHYSVHATDLIVCDKLFLTGMNPMPDGGQNFLSMIEVLAALFPYGKRKPQTYLAFRGTDMMMSKYSETFRRRFLEQGVRAKEAACYEAVLKQMETLIENDGDVSCLERFGDDLLLDACPEEYRTITEGDVVSHILSRLGGDNAHGFRLLLQVSETHRSRLESYDVLPPHVFFTATPIDSDFRFYVNDPANVTRFIRQENGVGDKASNRITNYAFHVEIAKRRIQHLCFGTLQLISSIMENNGINIK